MMRMIFRRVRISVAQEVTEIRAAIIDHGAVTRAQINSSTSFAKVACYISEIISRADSRSSCRARICIAMDNRQRIPPRSKAVHFAVIRRGGLRMNLHP